MPSYILESKPFWVVGFMNGTHVAYGRTMRVSGLGFRGLIVQAYGVVDAG